VRATGGLEDTIVSFDRSSKHGNGVKFGPYKAAAFLSAIRTAIDLYTDPEDWKILMANGMQADFSWDRSASRYIEIYQSIRKP
jgi:starch synthase